MVEYSTGLVGKESIEVNSEMQGTPPTRRAESGQAAVQPIMIVLLVLIAALVGGTIYLYLELDKTRKEMDERFVQHQEQLAALEGSLSQASRSAVARVQEVQGEVQKQLAERTQQVEQRVLGRTQRLAQQFEQTSQQQQTALRDVGGKLNHLEETTGSRFGSLTGRVEGVATELTEAQKELERTIADLQSVRGDLGVQSGLIATNSEELSALRELGERNYYEFDLNQTKEPLRVGRIQIRLRNTNEGKQRYTVDVYADDKRIQKKNKTLLEPVQFYVMGSRQPYEIVVNQLEKNRIAGYLATPKVESGRTTAAEAGDSSD